MLIAETRSVVPEELPGRSRERGGGAGLEAPSRMGRKRELGVFVVEEKVEVEENEGRREPGVEGADGVGDVNDAVEATGTGGGAGDRVRGVLLGDGLREPRGTTGAARDVVNTSSAGGGGGAGLFARDTGVAVVVGLRTRGVGVFARSSFLAARSAA